MKHLRTTLSVILAASTLLVACSDSSVAPESGSPDADIPVSGTPGANTPDANTPDAGNGSDGVITDSMLANDDYRAAAQSVSGNTLPVEARGAAKNIILFVGDGMGISTVTAARILDGQLKGEPGEENQLSWGVMPFVGLSKTYNVDAQTADSAGTMSAMMTGVKTDAGVFGVDEDVRRGQCSSQAGNELITALELAEIAGMSTGIVSTARITHATPAATYAKSVDRGWENNAALTEEAIAQGCIDIALQLVSFEQRLEARYPGLDVDGMEVAMGGGRRNFLPNNAASNSNDTVSEVEGARTDGLDLTLQWQSIYPQGVYITDQAGFDAVNVNDTQHVLALFDEDHMEYEANRLNDLAGEPSLAQMTAKAIDLLDNNDRGYFLSVEAGRIDHAHHAGSAFGALTDTIEFSQAVQVAMDASNPADTLIIVTADHSHVFTIGGIAKRGNPILGLSVGIGADAPRLAEDGLPYTTLAYANGLGFRNFGENTNFDRSYTLEPDAGRKDLSFVDTASSGFHQESLVPLSSETHSGEDVGIYAQGPGASMVTGTSEQSVLFHVMEFAADLEGRANSVLNER
ncbi:MAG: alkaline phosphatase [Granulosicoccus sp.]